MLNVKLKVIGGDAKTAEVNLRLPTIIGRSKQATLTLPHPLVSRNHCELFERDSQLWVKDLASLNGTFIDNIRLEGEQILEPKQLLTIGNVTFRAVYGSELDANGNVLDEDREEASFAKAGDSSKVLAAQQIEFEEAAGQSSALDTKPTEAGRSRPDDLETVFIPTISKPPTDDTVSPVPESTAEQDSLAEASIISALAGVGDVKVDDSVSLSVLEGLEIDQNQIQSAEISSVNIHDGNEAPQSVGQSFLNAIDANEIEAKISAGESSLDSFIRKLPK